MSWMLTCSGSSVNLRYIDPQRIDIEDVAYALSNINRFNGHAVRNISQAEHSVVVYQIVQKMFCIDSAPALMAALLSRGHEYLTGHISGPMQQMLGTTEWDVIEASIQRQFLGRFGLTTAFATYRRVIDAANQYATSAQREQLMPPGGDPWDCEIKYPASHVPWLKFNTAAVDHKQARQSFLNVYRELQKRMRPDLTQRSSLPGAQP